MIFLSELLEVKERLLESIGASIDETLEDNVKASCTHIINAKKVFVYGVGRSGLVAQSFAIRLVQLGLEAHFIGEMTTPIVMKGDLAIIVSNTGSTMSATQTANIIRREGVPVIAVTSRESSKLAHAATLVIQLKSNEAKKNLGDITPLGTLFEDAALIFFDIMIVCLMRKLERDEKYMRSRHSIWV